MNIYDLLTDKEIDIMNYYITSYGPRESSATPCADMKYLLRVWEEAKSEYLYKIFDNNLIIEKSIKFEKDNNQVEDEIRNKITYSYSGECRKFLKEWTELGIKLSEETNNRYVYQRMQRLICSNVLASNRYDHDEGEIPLPEDKKYRLSVGCKASKAIGKIARAYNLSGYEEFRICHSQILNEKSLSGTLCLSIHPLDYMTMSDNDCGWSSCMSWNDYGDYRQGTVEMMNSSSVVVAYLKSSTDYAINSSKDYYWSSKRWRQLFIVDKGFIVGIKGYPYWNLDLENITVQWLAELAEKAGIGIYENHNKNYNGRNKEIEISSETEENNLGLYFNTWAMYNDFYEDHVIRLAKDYSLIPQSFKYSGPSECMSCGETYFDFDTEQDLYCFRCDDSMRCLECGCYYSIDDMIEIDGEYYCQDCFENYFAICPSCGDTVRNKDLVEVYLGLDEKHVWRDRSICVCYNCCCNYNYNTFFDNSKLKTISTDHYSWSKIYYIHPEDLTEAGLDEFGFKTVEEARNYKSNRDPFECYKAPSF